MYYDFREPISRIARHRVLQLTGEKEGFLQVKIEVPEELIIEFCWRRLSGKISITGICCESRRRFYSADLTFVENEVRNELTELA